jgi:hypothetical protein
VKKKRTQWHREIMEQELAKREARQTRNGISTMRPITGLSTAITTRKEKKINKETTKGDLGLHPASGLYWSSGESGGRKYIRYVENDLRELKVKRCRQKENNRGWVTVVKGPQSQGVSRSIR